MVLGSYKIRAIAGGNHTTIPLGSCISSSLLFGYSCVPSAETTMPRRNHSVDLNPVKSGRWQRSSQKDENEDRKSP
ncbi:hypothetical protein AKJ16_DCAP18327 [Drosera capensis]